MAATRRQNHESTSKEKRREREKGSFPAIDKLLPTSVIGSYSVPEWLERAKTDYLQRRISGDQLQDMHNIVIQATVKDQERAGIDIVTDGELRRDNDIDYFAYRIPGVEIDHRTKAYYYDFYDSVIRHKIPTASLGLVPDLEFLLQNTDRAVKFTLTGPFTLAKRIKNEYYPHEEEVALEFARILNGELKALAKAGADYIQLDESYLTGYPEDLAWVVRAINIATEGVEAHIILHVCYGNRYGKPYWDGNYRFLFPAIFEANIHQLAMEFARKGDEDLELFSKYPSELELGVGVIDVKSSQVETPEQVAERVRRALKHVRPEKLYVNPDCGLHHLSRDIAFKKLQAMVQGTEIVRKELLS
jgi:5-methyltetrahydropteroyltriglutamate--homocysteine methyltransferase